MKNQKTCSFFVSTTHLLTIILPYINEKINEGKNVKIISQKDLTEDVKKYLKCVKEFNYEKIMQISWKGKKENKPVDDNTVLFIIGNKDFVESSQIKNLNCEVVVCYEVKNIEVIENVAEKYEFYLRTDGKVNIINNSHKGQNSNTVISQI